MINILPGMVRLELFYSIHSLLFFILCVTRVKYYKYDENERTYSFKPYMGRISKYINKGFLILKELDIKHDLCLIEYRVKEKGRMG